MWYIEYKIMKNAANPIQVDPAKFTEEGLYLVFPDGNHLTLNKKNIECLANAYWASPEKIPPEIRQAADFQLCAHCPEKGKDVLCCALKPLIPYIDQLDQYWSYDRVTAVYRSEDSPVLHVVETSTQEALKYLSLLSLTFYCKMGSKYGRYFKGVNPLMGIEMISNIVFLNIYFHERGDEEKVKVTIENFKREILDSSSCMVKRLHLLCDHDSFVNAFINAQLVSQFLELVDQKAA